MLAIGPGLVAVVGGLPWASITVLPGLVVSGGALLFGLVWLIGAMIWARRQRVTAWGWAGAIGVGLTIGRRLTEGGEFHRRSLGL